MPKRLPVTLVTGFLGSGKTTLLRYLLKHSHKKLAVMVNEFGSIGLDGDLFRSCGFCSQDELEGRLVELNNGCLCCTVQEDFLPTMETLLSRSIELDGILIETSGLALPEPLIRALLWPSIRSKVHINGVVTVVDGAALEAGSPIGDISTVEKQRLEDENIDHLTSLDDLFSNQLAYADLVLISRADCISPYSLKKIELELSSKARSATPIIPIINGEINPSIVLGLDQQNNFDFSIEEEHDHDHVHVNVISSTLRLEIALDKHDLERVLSDLVVQYKIIRLKGRCWLPTKTVPLQVQMVGPRLDTWFEKIPETSWQPKQYGIEFVILSLKKGAKEAITSALHEKFSLK